MNQPKIRLGDLLVQNGLISDEQLVSALGEQRKTGRKLGATLIGVRASFIGVVITSLECAAD